jgi:hypothetical protein
MRLVLLGLFTFLYFLASGQISGVVNTYHKVTDISNSEVITLDNVNGLEQFDKVLIIQMKGASVKTNTTDESYGSILGLGNAGTYEVATICDVDEANNTVTLVHKLITPASYTPSNGKVQMVKIARYETETVNGTLLAGDWNNTTGTGGVLAIMANELILNAPISADGKGFKGGRFELTSGSFCRDNYFPDYNYDPTPSTYNFIYSNMQLGASKGESIIDPILSHQGGKGAMATGGGGGNNHNTAGGGGSNIGTGGMGGNNTTKNSSNQPVCVSDHPGIGGYALSFDAKRLFMGGGGGAGHGNNTVETGSGGGHGGGIVFIIAGTLISNGYSISASGGSGLQSLGDGASGGGGGGSIILNVGNFLDAPVVSANGGKGGAVDNENIAKRCYGEGGGGGGGAIYFSGARQGITSVSGGAKGDRILSDLYCTQSNMARDGSVGGIFDNYTYREASGVSTCPGWSSLPVNLLYFKATNKGAQVTTEWKVGNPEDAYQYVLQRRATNTGWQNVHTIAAESNTTQFKKEDGPLAAGIYFYRLKIVEKNRDIVYSPVQQITIKSEDANRLVIYPNPSSQVLNIILPSKKDDELHIYDMNSKLVYRKKITSTDALIKQDISFLAEGVYMVQVGKLTARFVVFK